MKTEHELLRELQDKTYEELNDKSKYTIKNRCFICGAICNPELLWEYYQRHGNCCLPCSGRCSVKKKLAYVGKEKPDY